MTTALATAPLAVLTLPKPSPSLSTWQSWQWTRRARARKQWTEAFAAQLVRMRPRPVTWAAKLEEEDRPPIAVCRGCSARPQEVDARGNTWCVVHLHAQPAPARRRVVYRRFCAGELDPTNFAGGLKGIEDAVVRVGLLFDDSNAFVVNEYEQVFARRSEGRLVIEVWET